MRAQRRKLLCSPGGASCRQSIHSSSHLLPSHLCDPILREFSEIPEPTRLWAQLGMARSRPCNSLLFRGDRGQNSDRRDSHYRFCRRAVSRMQPWKFTPTSSRIGGRVRALLKPAASFCASRPTAAAFRLLRTAREQAPGHHRETLLHDSVQLISGQGIPPATSRRVVP